MIIKVRKIGKKVILVINKCDKQKSSLKKFEFSEFGLTEYFEVSAKTNKGLEKLVESIFSMTKSSIYRESKTNRIAFIGKPNVGKSTLIRHLNRLVYPTDG